MQAVVDCICIDESGFSIDDTVETIDLAQEKIVVDYYDKRIINDKIYYIEKVYNALGKMYIYDSTLANKVRLPKPVGEIKIIDGKRKLAFYKKKNKKNSS